MSFQKKNKKDRKIPNDVSSHESGIDKKSDEYVFQILDWRAFHEAVSIDSDETPEEEEERDEEDIKKEFKIGIYGMTDDKKTIYVEVNKFTPYFFVEIPTKWTRIQIERLINHATNQVYPRKMREHLLSTKVFKKYKFRYFTNNKKFKFIRFVFDNHNAFRAYERVFRRPIRNKMISKQPKKFQLYESNIEPMLRCMHIRDLNACGWVKIKKNNCINTGKSPSICEINLDTHWKNLEKVDSNHIQPFVIASFDIECTSGDGSFPQATRSSDQVIQIGTTFSYYGDSECFYKHIVTLGSCDKLKGIDVESYDTERDVLLAWTKMIRKMNPDILTGYNIFGFDYKYLHDRSKLLKCSKAFSKLSRRKNDELELTEKNLSSAALGQNFLFFYDMTGRVNVDLMKVVMRDFNLENYKLDFVAAWFIREEIESINTNTNEKLTTLTTKNTKGLYTGDYVSIYYNDGLTDNKYGEKYKILELGDKSLVVKGVIEKNLMKNKKVYWTQAKDDVPPKDIFKFQKGSSADRAKIAKYCIKDCALCNRLINKLQVITNSVGMANVCSIPLSYLFLRGQGVKIFSLVARECRKKNYLIPVLRKKFKPNDKQQEEIKQRNMERKIRFGKDYYNGDDDEEEDNSYEGATVFPPEKGVHFEPIAVNDYSSLYPSSMIHRNISHECLLTLDQFNRFRNNYYTYRTSMEELKKLEKKKRKTSKMLDLKKIIDDFEQYKTYEDFVFHKVTYKSGKDSDEEIKAKKKGEDKFVDSDEEDIDEDRKVTCYYAQHKDGRPGILPEILKYLLSARKATKKEMNNETNPFKKSILDGLQLAYKMTANSLYGQTGAATSSIHLKDVAASTTATGREMLRYSKYFTERAFTKIVKAVVENNRNKYDTLINKLLDLKNIDDKVYKYHKSIFVGSKKIIYKDNAVKEIIKRSINENERLAKFKMTKREEFINYYWNEVDKVMKGYDLEPRTVYGDSVIGDTPLLLKNKKTNNIVIKKIKDLVSTSKYIPDYHGDKEFVEIENYQSWTETGWTDIQRVIRHKVNKRLIRVRTQTGDIVVTEDHSLLTPDAEKISPNDLQLGDNILSSYTIEEDIINKYHIPEKAIDKLVTVFHSQRDARKNEFVPVKIMNSDKETMNKFFEKYAIFDKYYPSAEFYYLASVLNKNPYFDEGFIKLSSEKIKNHSTITSLSIWNKDEEYVYDLTTNNHHFQAGKGQLVAHNTDSTFINYHILDRKTKEPQTDHNSLKIAIRLGLLMGELIYLVLPAPHDFEYEKTFWPFMILSKKRYVGNLYEENPNKYKQKSMGIVLKRRDNAPIVKIVVGGIVDKILNDHSAIKAVKFTQETLKALLSGKYTMDKFIITKTLKSDYADRTTIVHAVLADKLAERDPGNKPQSNDRIPYVFIEEKHLVCQICNEKVNVSDCKCRECLGMFCPFHIDRHLKECIPKCRLTKETNKKKISKCETCGCWYTKEAFKKHMTRNDRKEDKVYMDKCKHLMARKILQGDRAEIPNYVIEQGYKLDYLYYMIKQIMKPSVQFLELMVKNPNKIFEDYINREMNRRFGKKPIKYWVDYVNSLDDEEYEKIFGKSESFNIDDDIVKKNDIKLDETMVKKKPKKKSTTKKKKFEVERENTKFNKKGEIELTIDF